MNPICSAPALIPLLAIVACLSGLGAGLPVIPSVLAGTAVTAGFLCFISGIERTDYRKMALFLLILSMGLSFLVAVRASWEPRLPEPVDSSFVIQLERSWGGRRLIVLAGREGKYIARLLPSKTFTEGSRVRITGTAEPLARAAGPGKFDEHDYWRARGVLGALKVEKIRMTGEVGKTLHGWRQRLRQKILLNLPPRVRGYLLACWLGDRDPDLKGKHQVWGTAHLLAVSGFHVGLVCTLGYWLFRRRKGRALAVSLMLWGYVFLAGSSASALRAGLMIQVMLIGSILGRGANPLNSVAAAACLLVVWRPWWFWDVGWRLSVLAAVSLAALSRYEGKWRIILASPLIWIVTAGTVASTFGEVPLAGLVLNLAALPLFGFLLPVAALVAIPGLTGFGNGTAYLAEGLFFLWEKFADTVTLILPLSLHGSKGLALISGMVFLVLLCRSLDFSRFRTLTVSTYLLAMAAML